MYISQATLMRQWMRNCKERERWYRLSEWIRPQPPSKLNFVVSLNRSWFGTGVIDSPICDMVVDAFVINGSKMPMSYMRRWWLFVCCVCCGACMVVANCWPVMVVNS